MISVAGLQDSSIRMQKSRSQGMKIPVIRMISSMLQWEMYRLAITKSMTADMNVSISWYMIIFLLKH